MEGALVTHDFSIQYVAENNARETPLFFTVISLWAALAGSILQAAVKQRVVSLEAQVPQKVR